MTLRLQTMSSICTIKRSRTAHLTFRRLSAEGPALFATNPALRLDVHSALLGADVWDSLEIVMVEPVLLVTTSQPIEDDIRASRAFLVKAQHLATMRRSKEVRIDTVDLLSPARVNGTAGWRLDRLNEVWKCRDPDDTHIAWLFCLASGAKFCDSPVNDPPSKLVREQCVFSAEAPSKHPQRRVSVIKSGLAGSSASERCGTSATKRRRSAADEGRDED